MVDDSAGLSIRGRASGPYIVQASNFAPGTTAADIESVMQGVGGQMNYCRLVSATPTVIAQMSFLDKAGADAVIKMFNNKKVSQLDMTVMDRWLTDGARLTGGPSTCTCITKAAQRDMQTAARRRLRWR